MAKRYGRGCVWPANCPLNAENWSFLQRKYHFTPRELQIAIAVCRGCDNKKLAEHLDIEVNTAKVYLRIVYRKVGVDNKILLLLSEFSASSALLGSLLLYRLIYYILPLGVASFLLAVHEILPRK